MTKKTKLELTWPGKEERPKLEPRILIEDPAKSYHASARREGDLFDNMLIKGDNLLALKALEQDYAGKVKCVFIDPPYNTGSAFTHYDDGLEHSLWLSLMRDRLEIIRRLLAEDGSLWVTLDDNEAHYFKVLADEVFGRSNFVSNVIWQKAYGPRSNASHISNSHDHVIVYAKNVFAARFGLVERSAEQTAKYKNEDNDPRGPWKPENSSISLLSGQRGKQFAKTGYSENVFEIVSPTGVRHMPPNNRCWAFTPKRYEQLKAEGRIWFGKDGNSRPSVKKFLNEISPGVMPQSVWLHDDVGHNQEASREISQLFPRDPFGTPKPERLLQRILHLATNPGDLVLDSFAGSGTTGAVAHKMGRRWIMVEIGDHADTHIVPRLQKVIDGADQGGISKAVDWKGGGGFRYFTLAPSLLEQDKYGNWVIAQDYNPAMLAEAMCKHMGFTYAPAQDPAEYWRHGHSTETDFIYVTTQALTHDACAKIAHDVGPDRSLLICCKAYDAAADAFENLTLVKIPTAILQKCEWGRDDYSLNIQNLPMAEDDEAAEAAAKAGGAGLPLFGGEAGDE
jgi:adenine-specific DNA-methyltransferase